MDRWQLETYVLPRWGKRGIREISKRDVKRLLEDLAAGTIARGGEPTKVAARNLRAVLSKMFEWVGGEPEGAVVPFRGKVQSAFGDR